MYAGLLLVKVRTVTERLIDDEQGCFNIGRRCVSQIFTWKHLGEKVKRGYSLYGNDGNGE